MESALPDSQIATRQGVVNRPLFVYYKKYDNLATAGAPMMLSTMTRQHRLVSLPLMAALVVSWCLLLCSMPMAQAAELQEPTPTSHAEQPPCHGEADTLSHDSHGTTTSNADQCPSCEAQPEPASSAAASAMILSTLDWMQALSAPPISTTVAANAPPDQPPPPARLHLIKAVFLI